MATEISYWIFFNVRWRNISSPDSVHSLTAVPSQCARFKYEQKLINLLENQLFFFFFSLNGLQVGYEV